MIIVGESLMLGPVFVHYELTLKQTKKDDLVESSYPVLCYNPLVRYLGGGGGGGDQGVGGYEGGACGRFPLRENMEQNVSPGLSNYLVYF